MRTATEKSRANTDMKKAECLRQLQEANILGKDGNFVEFFAHSRKAANKTRKTVSPAKVRKK